MKRLTTAMMILICTACLWACGSRGPDAEEITLNDIIEANSLAVLMEEYDNIFIQEDTVDINGYVLDTSYHRFALEDGQLVGDVWHENKEEGKMAINARNGVLYGLMGNRKHVIIIPEEDYFDRVEMLYPLLPDPEIEELTSSVKEDQTILVTTVTDTFADGSPAKSNEYILDEETLQIQSMQIIDYNETGMKTGIIGFSVKYDSTKKADDSAWKSITQPSDGRFCNVTAVIQPRTADEEVRNVQVDHECNVEVAGKSSYDLYKDETCHIPVAVIDTTADDVTIYAKAVR